MESFLIRGVKMKRKVVQICTTSVKNTYETQCDFITTALCDDGSMWIRYGNKSEWNRIEEVPDFEGSSPAHLPTVEYR